MKRITILMGTSLAVMFFVVADVRAQSFWTLSGGGVWDIPAAKRVAWNPAAGDIGNMGAAGVVFNVAAAPANVQAGAAAQAANGYTMWNALAAVPTVRINFVAGAAAAANSQTSWGALAATTLGSTNNVAINFNDRDITLNNAKTLRSDGWNIFETSGGGVEEFDTFTVNFHEAGHVLGLNHPGRNTQIMAQTGASLQAGGRFKSVEQVTPFVGQPMSLNAAGVPANALPNGTETYFRPRNTFGLGDALGAMTLYSAPISRITSAFQAIGAGLGKFTYLVANDSAEGMIGNESVTSAYDQRKITVPLSPGVPVSNMSAPFGYSITRDSIGVHVESIDPIYNLKPGNSLQFSFDSTDFLGLTKPATRWAIFGLGTDFVEDPIIDADHEDEPVAPPFSFNDFAVLDGTFTYEFNALADHWDLVLYDDVLIPLIPEPATLAMLMVAIVFLAFGRARSLGA